MWDRILKFYEETTQSTREDEMWDKIRYHCAKIQILISEIRKNEGLELLHAHLSVLQLCIINPANECAVRILILHDNIVKITVLNINELADAKEYKVIQSDMLNSVKILQSILLDEQNDLSSKN